jgi:3',5'-cyclic-AMP phosphodiesterase
MSKGMGMALSKKNKQEDLTVIQISDTHLMNKDDLEFVHMNPAETFHAVIADIQEKYPNVDVIFHTGDLAQVSVPETYDNYLSFMAKLNIPHFQIPGNHDNSDIFPFFENTDKAHAIHLGHWTVVLLNSAVKGQVSGWIEDEQLAQLDQILTENKDQNIIITCHHHPLEMNSRWIDHHKLKNTKSLTDILAKHKNVKMVLCGHVHQDSLNTWNNINFYSTPSTCVQFKPKSENFALDDTAPGYRVLHLKANGMFETKIHRIEENLPQLNLDISGY